MNKTSFGPAMDALPPPPQEKGGAEVRRLLRFLDYVREVCILPLNLVASAIDKYEEYRQKNILGHAKDVRFLSTLNKRSGFTPTDAQLQDWEKSSDIVYSASGDKVLAVHSKIVANTVGANLGDDYDSAKSFEEMKSFNSLPSPHEYDEEKYNVDTNLLTTEAMSYEASVDTILGYFPSYTWKSLRYILKCLTYQSPVYGESVKLFDVLTILVILLRGTVEDKAKYFFTFYNITGNGLLSETEHRIFLENISKLLNKMNFIGSIDITLDDIDHMVLVARARIYASTKNIEYLPGLRLQEFIEWINNNRECAIVFSFFRILDSLVETMLVLDNRSTAINKIVMEREKCREKTSCVPKIDLLNCKSCSSNVYIVGRSSKCVSICLQVPVEGSDTREYYIECKKLVPISGALYEVPELMKANNDRYRALRKKLGIEIESNHCCHKVYELDFRQRYYIPCNSSPNSASYRSNATKLHHRIEVNNLDPDSRYILTVYSHQWKYKSIETCTRSRNMSNDSFCILPSSLSLYEAKFFVENLPDIMDSSAVVFTGAICSVDNIIKQAIVFSDRTNPEQYSTVITAAIDTLYNHEWNKCVSELFGIFAAGNNVNIDGLVSALAVEKQLLVYAGMGPWSSFEFKKLVELELGSNYFEDVNVAMNNLYDEYMNALKPSFHHRFSNIELLFLNNCLSSTDTTYAGSTSFNIRHLISLFTSGSSFFDEVNHVIVLIKSLDHDLLDTDFPMEQKSPEIYTDVELHNQTGASVSLRKVRGKHEILHGEYSNVTQERDETATKGSETLRFTVSNDDHDLTYISRLLNVIFQWLNVHHERKVTLVSCAWPDGYNFDIAAGGRVLLKHESLLSTYGDIEKVRRSLSYLQLDGIVKRLNANLIILPPTDMRCIKICNRDVSFFSVGLVMEKYIRSGISSLPIQIINGPRIIGLSCNHVLVTSRSFGYGILQFTLYELPYNLNYDDVISLVVSEKPSLRKIEVIEKRCTGKTEHIVRFDGLNSYCSYCVHIDQLFEDPNNIPSICHFRTLPMPSSVIESIVIAGVTDKDYTQPSAVINKVTALLETCRSRSTPIYLIHARSTVPIALYGLSKPSLGDIHQLYKLANVIHITFDPKLSFSGIDTCSTTQPANEVDFRIFDKNSYHENWCNLESYDNYGSDGVHITWNGKFCRIAPRDGSYKSMEKVIELLDIVNTLPHIEHLTVIVQRPLIRYLQKYEYTSGDQWVCDGLIVNHQDLCARVFEVLIDWKRQQPTRDCVVVTVGEVTRIKVITIKEKLQQVSPTSLPVVVDEINTQLPVDNDEAHLQSDKDIIATDASDEISVLGNSTQGENMDDNDLMDDISVATYDKYGALDKESALDVDRELEKSLLLQIRHIVFPLTVGGKGARDSLIFPATNGLYHLNSLLEYTVNDLGDDLNLYHDTCEKFYGLTLHSPKCDLHGDAIQLDSQAESSVHVIDSTVRSDNPDDRDSKYESKEFPHHIYARSFIHDIDFVDVIVGPVIGAVTENSAIIQFEVNRNLQLLQLNLVPFEKEKYQSVTVTKEKIIAFTPFVFKPDNLVGNCLYYLYLPVLYGNKCLGMVRTQNMSKTYTEVVITGDEPYSNLAIVHKIITQINEQNSIDLNYMDHFIKNIYHNNIAFGASSMEYLSTSDVNSFERSNTLTWLSEYYRSPCANSDIIIHLGSHAMLPSIMEHIVGSLLQHGRKLFLPLADSPAYNSWIFIQFEDIVKDTFRLLWSNPTVRDALAVGSHWPIFHSDYLLPIEPEILNRHIRSDLDRKLIQIIRTLYQSNLVAYIHSLYEFDAEKNSNHYRVWRSGPLVIVLLDIVTERKKAYTKQLKRLSKLDSKDMSIPVPGVKGNGKNDEYANEALGGNIDKDAVAAAEDSKASMAESHPFSNGFLDKSQWKLLKNLSTDRTINHVIICSEKPFVSLEEIPRQYNGPIGEALDKGSMLEWGPTVEDLNVFLQFWINWINNRKDSPYTTRNVVLCSSNRDGFPYSTTLSDLYSGLKIQQFCVGTMNTNPTLIDETRRKVTKIFEDDSFVMNGKIGSIRYVHQFDQLENILVNSGRERIEKGGVLKGDISVQRPKIGFAIMKMWFDTWKSVGSWSYCSVKLRELEKLRINSDVDPILPYLIVGPVIGAPYLVSDATRIMVPFMVEVNVYTTITLSILNIFTGQTEMFTFKAKPLRPIVQILGPLLLESRYIIQIVSGAKIHSDTNIVISTHINWNESNIAVVNDDLSELSYVCSEHIVDLVNRTRVPFNGITAVIHMNSQPSLQVTINELMELPGLTALLHDGRKNGILTPTLFKCLDLIIERLRQQYRSLFSRPSFAELLRSTFNIFINSKDPIPVDDIDLSDDKLLLFQLIITRLNQEYFDQLTFVGINVFRSFESSEKSIDAVKNGVHPVPVDVDEDMGESYLYEMDHETDDKPMTEEMKEDIRRKLEKASYRKKLMDDFSLNSMERLVFPGHFGANKHIYYSDTKMHPVEAIFEQWVKIMTPAEYEWMPWITPNGKVSIERIGKLDDSSIHIVGKQLDENPLENNVGVRLFILNELCLDHLLSMEDMYSERFAKKILKLTNKFTALDRNICVVSPSSKGSATMKLKYEVGAKEDEQGEIVPVYSTPVNIYTADSIFRHNEYERNLDSYLKEDFYRKEKEKELKALKKAGGKGGNSKKAIEKREAEEKKRQEEQLRAVQDQIDVWKPDGYLMVECRTSNMLSRDGKSDILTLLNVTVIGSLYGGRDAELLIYQRAIEDAEMESKNRDLNIPPPSFESLNDVNTMIKEPVAVINGIKNYATYRPAPGDYIQMPEWLIKFSPSPDKLFAQDEILLWMRQDSKFKKCLDFLESDEIFIKIMGLYENSRLSELARPPDLREVNLDVPGVKQMLLKSIITRVVTELIPNEISEQCVTLVDDFARSYCLVRALPDEAALGSPETFAKAIQYALVLSMTLKVSYDFSALDKYKFILDSNDTATRNVYDKADRDQRLASLHAKHKLLDGNEYDKEKIDQLFIDEENERLEKGKVDYESDMEELDRENAARERAEEDAEEAAERAERLAELAELEAEALEEEAARFAEEQAAKLLEEEEAARNKANANKNNDDNDVIDDVDDVDAAEAKEKALFAEMQRKLEQEKEALLQIEFAVLDVLIADAIQYLSNEQIATEDLAASLVSHTVVLTSAERINEALTQVQRLKTERFLQRRNLFSKITYMS